MHVLDRNTCDRSAEEHLLILCRVTVPEKTPISHTTDPGRTIFGDYFLDTFILTFLDPPEYRVKHVFNTINKGFKADSGHESIMCFCFKEI